MRAGRWVVPVVVAVVLVLASCGSERGTGLYDVEDERVSVDERKVLRLIAQLGRGRAQGDPRASMAFDEAVNELTLMGSSIEPLLIEALVGDDDWAVRQGVIHVLDSLGSKHCVPALIGALADSHPMVAKKAMHTLRVFCDHRLVPESGPAGDNGLPSIPERTADDLRPDADLQIWLDWHAAHGDALHRAWKEWWDDNRHRVRIE